MVRGFAVLALVLAASSGCNKRVKECNRLVDVINAEQPKIAQAARQGPGEQPTPEALHNFAIAVDELVSKTRAVDLRDARLIEYRSQYITLAENLAKSARKTAEVFEDTPEANKAVEQLNSYKPKERELVKQINDYCAGKED